MGRDHLLPLLDALGELAEATSVTALCAAVLDAVQVIAPGDSVVVTWLAVPPVVVSDPPGCLAVGDLPTLEEPQLGGPWILASHRRRGGGQARRISDRYGPRQYRGRPIDAGLVAGPGVKCQLAFSVAAGECAGICVAVTRSAGDFSADEVSAADRLGHLVKAPATRVAALTRCPGESGAARLDRLTPRELDVLERVGRGSSDAQVGVQLAISTRTVNKHLEDVYAKLNVHNRTEAAVLWHEVVGARKAGRGLLDVVTGAAAPADR